jgi:hypothetical protein
MTPLEKFIEYIGEEKLKNHNIKFFLELEEKCIKDAIMYSLDEDGHTGDWKLKFANEYYDKLKKVK